MQNAMMDAVLDNDGATCDSLREDGFDSRPLCYEKTGFCLFISRSQSNVDALEAVYDLNDADTQRARTQVASISNCVAHVQANFFPF